MDIDRLHGALYVPVCPKCFTEGKFTVGCGIHEEAMTVPTCALCGAAPADAFVEVNMQQLSGIGSCCGGAGGGVPSIDEIIMKARPLAEAVFGQIIAARTTQTAVDKLRALAELGQAIAALLNTDTDEGRAPAKILTDQLRAATRGMSPEVQA